MKRIVFDTETATAGAIIWNFAAMEVDDLTGERKLLANIVNKTYLDHAAMSGAMFAPNEQKKLIVQNAEQLNVLDFLKVISDTIQYANDNEITMAAYNIPFDMRATSQTGDFYGMKMPIIQKPYDLYKEFVACVPVEYFLWTLATHRLTPKGNPRMNAESAYAFITKTDFVESHTALEDVIAEVEIMLWLDKRQPYKTENDTYRKWYKSVLVDNAENETEGEGE